MDFCYPRLSRVDLGCVRLIGPGLGNLLFPWARAAVAARRHRVPIIWPTWPQLRVGSILRGERDKRFYFGLFRRPDGYVGGIGKARLLTSAARVPERDSQVWNVDRGAPPRLVVFGGMDGMFEPILEQHQFVSRELARIVSPRQMAAVPRRTGIAAHVRLGDFGHSSTHALSRGADNARIPISWYIEMIEGLRARLGADREVTVYSDGTDLELEPVLAMRHVRRAPPGASIADMLALSRAAVLIASGSTFSMWASFLGRMPVIWHPGQLRQRLYPDSSSETEVEVGGANDLTASFVEAALRRFE